MIYWELNYRANKVGHPWMAVAFNDERYAFNSLKKFLGEYFDKLTHRIYGPTYQEWSDPEQHGMDSLIATLSMIEVKPYARAVTLPTEDKAA